MRLPVTDRLWEMIGPELLGADVTLPGEERGGHRVRHSDVQAKHGLVFKLPTHLTKTPKVSQIPKFHSLLLM